MSGTPRREPGAEVPIKFALMLAKTTSEDADAVMGEFAEQILADADVPHLRAELEAAREQVTKWRKAYDTILSQAAADAREAQRVGEQIGERRAAEHVTEYRIPCPGHRLGVGADIIVQRMPTEDRWAVLNPNLDHPVQAWTGEQYERIGDIYRRDAYRWTRDQALDLAPGLAERETARDRAWFEEMRVRGPVPRP